MLFGRTVECEQLDRLIDRSRAGKRAEVFGSGPDSDGSAWLALIHNDSSTVTAHIAAFADCAGQ